MRAPALRRVLVVLLLEAFHEWHEHGVHVVRQCWPAQIPLNALREVQRLDQGLWSPASRGVHQQAALDRGDARQVDDALLVQPSQASFAWSLATPGFVRTRFAHLAD